MIFRLTTWLKISIINLLIVAIIGLLMRYKICFEFPYFSQKFIQFSHSHFAFYGWVSHTIMALMVNVLQKNGLQIQNKKYNNLLLMNLVGSYGMLIFFFFLGYKMPSIVFSLLSVGATYYFSILFVKDSQKTKLNPVSRKWFLAALLFNALSTLGTFGLGIMMATKNFNQDYYLSFIYYFLHFQYNGWFFFACMGLLFDLIQINNSNEGAYNKIFNLFFYSCILGYLLSILWLNLPTILYIFVVIAAIAQTYGWVLLVKNLSKSGILFKNKIVGILRFMFFIITLAISVKLCLQLGSTIPTISKLAFGFRPIVIAYLHLVLLTTISLFLLFYIYANNLLDLKEKTKISLSFFVVGVLANQLILALQGIAVFSYIVLPAVNLILFGIAVFLVLSALALSYYSIKAE